MQHGRAEHELEHGLLAKGVTSNWVSLDEVEGGVLTKSSSCLLAQ
jgi:hypothetical protein